MALECEKPAFLIFLVFRRAFPFSISSPRWSHSLSLFLEDLPLVVQFAAKDPVVFANAIQYVAKYLLSPPSLPLLLTFLHSLYPFPSFRSFLT